MTLQSVKTRGQADHGRDEQPDRFAGPWFDAKTAAAYVPCKSVKAWYVWRSRHGIIARGNGSVAKADLDRELRKRSRRGRHGHPNSLANLGHVSHGGGVQVSRKFKTLESETR